MATNDLGSSDPDPTHGSGPDKETVAQSPGFEAAPHALENERGSNAADPGRGGCLKLGWGCLPVAAFLLATPTALLF